MFGVCGARECECKKIESGRGQDGKGGAGNAGYKDTRSADGCLTFLPSRLPARNLEVAAAACDNARGHGGSRPLRKKMEGRGGEGRAGCMLSGQQNGRGSNGNATPQLHPGQPQGSPRARGALSFSPWAAKDQQQPGRSNGTHMQIRSRCECNAAVAVSQGVLGSSEQGGAR